MRHEGGGSLLVLTEHILDLLQDSASFQPISFTDRGLNNPTIHHQMPQFRCPEVISECYYRTVFSSV